MMTKNTRWIPVLALGSILLASSGWANNNEDTEDTRVTSLEQAREANETAVKDAAVNLRVETQLDLDIRLLGPPTLKFSVRQ
ncbi:MAG: hypothetical protein VYD01_01390 [Pseudomonadota bacterium]|nr:hypothetical protein [Pseudomonadota bacterium]